MNAPSTTGTVLYVEDEEYDRLFMENAFRRAGIAEALRTVVNGQEAIDYLQGSALYADRQRYPRPALVLLDLNMPLVSGFEVLEWIRERPELAALPVVVFSSSVRNEDQAKARELGANAFLEKPQSMEKFGEVLDRLRAGWLDGRGGAVEH
jgi:CheY-like chemotaxis protein